MELQDKVKRLIAANAVLRETIKAKDKEIERLDKAAKDKYEYHAELIGKWAGECEDKDEEIDSLQSLNDFQQQQISCMQSDIDKMKCCGNCGNTEFDGGMGSCCKFDDLRCEGFSHWELKK